MYPNPIKFKVYKHIIKGNKELVFETVPKKYDYMYGVVAYALQNAFRREDGFIVERVEYCGIDNNFKSIITELKN